MKEELNPVVVREFIKIDQFEKRLQYEQTTDENYNKEKFISDYIDILKVKTKEHLNNDFQNGKYWDVKSDSSRIEIYIGTNFKYDGTDSETSEYHTRKLTELFSDEELNQFIKST